MWMVQYYRVKLQSFTAIVQQDTLFDNECYTDWINIISNILLEHSAT